MREAVLRQTEKGLMVIREVKRSDLAAVTNLLQGLSAFNPKELEQEKNWLGFISQANLLAIVAEIDEIVVGYGVLLIEKKIRGGKAGHIEDIVIHPDFRGIGIGRAITDFLAGRAVDLGCYKLVLQCSEENRGFYELIGYRQIHIAMQKFL
jgi:glucosamine-phosphate N-acetyltransferase